MPPRGRHRKRAGQGRDDAALDAMRAYGFPDRLIGETLKELQNVYGEDGWTFIEEGSYSVLLESLLDKVKKEEQRKEDTPDEGGDKDSNSTPTCSVGNSMASEQPMETTLPANETDAASHTNGAVNSPAGHFEMGGTGLKAIETAETPESEETSKMIVRVDRNTGSVERYVNTAPGSSGNFIPSTKPLDSDLTRTRKPCYGWISEDDGDDDLVELTPEPLSQDLKKLLVGVNGQRKRKSRWDNKYL